MFVLFDTLHLENYNNKTMDNVFQEKNKADLDKVVTLGVLLQFTDEFLIPKMTEVMGEMMDEKIALANAKLTHDLKIYIDEKQANLVSEIFERLDKKYQKEKQFKEKVLELFKKHNIGSSEDIAFLEGLVA